MPDIQQMLYSAEADRRAARARREGLLPPSRNVPPIDRYGEWYYMDLYGLLDKRKRRMQPFLDHLNRLLVDLEGSGSPDTEHPSRAGYDRATREPRRRQKERRDPKI